MSTAKIIDTLPKNKTVKQKRCPNGEHWNEKTQRCEPIVKLVKKTFLGCSRDYVPTEADAPRVNELKSKTGQELRDMISTLTGMPTGQKNQILGARRSNELINLIVCIENKKSEQPSAENQNVEITQSDIYPNEMIPEPEPAATEEPQQPSPLPLEMPPSNILLSPTPAVIPPPQTEDDEYNRFLFNHEKAEHAQPSPPGSLYPTLDDPDFNIKIASKKEFNDTKYDGEIRDIREHAQQLCNADFELMPHQLFVKNFLSFQTPYNSLLLYHGLGTGKTCSAIGIAEEMRKFMKQVGLNQRIIVVASPNVQNNFRLQLFDERKLKKDGELWDLNTCIGNELLSEINNTKDLARENIITKIKTIINQYYTFMGYTEFANFMERKTAVSEETGYSEKERKKIQISNIRRVFSNRLIIIDEAHNIRISDDNKKKKRTTALLMDVAKHSENMRLLLLSATPMYNSYKEIIWLTNVLNLVDKRSVIREEDVFDKDGKFLPPRKTKDGKDLEGGHELLQRKLTGYVSYVRSENPYTFPYRIYPEVFSPENTIAPTEYPSTQLNLRSIDTPIKHVPIFVTQIGEYQKRCYEQIVLNLRAKLSKKINEIETAMETFGYTILQQPLEALNIVYPNQDFDAMPAAVAPPVAPSISMTSASPGLQIDTRSVDIINNMVGKQGLANIMNSKKMQTPYFLRYDFEYKPEILQSYGRIFSPEKIAQYSGKIAKICESVMNSTGIVMIYSQFIDGGVIPVALALEELGFTRYGSANYTQSLMKKRTPAIEPVDALTLKKKSETPTNFHAAKYVMITGDQHFSPNNSEDIKYITNNDNKYGEKVKVVLITKAGAEGLDFKNIRQIHVLEPWYNMNRIEQMIGRGVRNLSHCMLPFEERNVEIYLHATVSSDIQEEMADMYVYRFAEKKAIQIGKVTRLLKEVAVDCILHIGQTNFTVDKLLALAKNQNITVKLSSGSGGPPVLFKIGDKPFTDICDYMDNCSYTCSPSAASTLNISKNTYDTNFIKMNYSTIVKRIRQLFREHSFYKRGDLINSINILKKYPVEQIDHALSRFVDNKNELLTDSLGRSGYLVNRDNIYAFQPAEIKDEAASLFERSVPVDYKHGSLLLELPKPMQSVRGPSVSVSVTGHTSVPVTVPGSIPVASVAETAIVAETEAALTAENIIEMIQNNMRVAFSSEELRLDTKEDNWFKNMNNVLDKLLNYHNIPLETIRKYVLYHNLDVLSFEEKISLIKYFETKENSSEMENLIHQYFEEKMVVNAEKGKRGVVLVNQEDELHIYLAPDWIEIDTVEYKQFQTDLMSKFVLTDAQRQTYNDTVGFMTLFKDRDIVFKTKTMTTNKNNRGVYCEIVGKQDVMKRINTLLGNTVYDEKFITKYITVEKRNKGTITQKLAENGIYKQGLCVILEILLRYYNEKAVNGKIWFLDLEKAKINKFVDYKR